MTITRTFKSVTIVVLYLILLKMPLIFFAFLKDFRMDMTISCTEEFQAQSNLAKLHYYILEKTILFATNPD